MAPSVLEFRSDTFTQPTPDMRAAMAAAEVGDDVFAEDPSINALQEWVAELLGQEAALFVPSGSMSNSVAIRTHCQPGDELICEADCHLYYYEQASFAQLCGVVSRTVPGMRGVLEPEQLHGLVRPTDDHFARTRLVCLENTHNRGGGTIQPYEHAVAICRWAHEQGLVTHLDGARLMNAVVATGIAAADWAKHFDTVSICFSKGLGAPVGSALAGTAETIRTARRHRKALGGGMRQAGILAAAALYALENHVDRLADDHANVRRLAELIAATDGLTLATSDVPTNMVYFDVALTIGTGQEFVDRLADHGLRMLATGPQRIRAVTHLDVNAAAVERAGEALRRVAGEG